MAILVDRTDLTLATASQTTDGAGTSIYRLPTDGHLISAEVSISEGGPVYAVISVGRTARGMGLASGWIRGPTTLGWAASLSWHGWFALERGRADMLLVHVRNDTGATVSIAVEWAVEL